MNPFIDGIEPTNPAWVGGIVGRVPGTVVSLQNVQVNNSDVSGYSAPEVGEYFGGPKANAKLYQVQNETKDLWYETIQEAIAVADAGDSIKILPGTYNEDHQIVVDKDLTIVGAGAATTIVKPTQNTGSSADARGWWLVPAGHTFNLSGLTLDGEGFNISNAIRSYSETTITDSVFKNISHPGYQGIAVVVYDANGTITGNSFSGIGRIGVAVYGAQMTAGLIENNTFIGKGEGNWVEYGVQLEAGATATVQNNTFSNYKGIASSDGSNSAGILASSYFAPNSTNATITGNTITDSTNGVFLGFNSEDNTTASISGNTISVDNAYIYASNPQSTTITIGENNLGNVVRLEGNPYALFTTIQAAVDAAEAGDTVFVGAGTYAEQVVIDKALTLQGPNADKFGFAEDRVEEAIITYPEDIVLTDLGSLANLITVESADVTIKGLRLEETAQARAKHSSLVFTWSANNLTVQNNVMMGTTIPVYRSSSDPTGKLENSDWLIEGNLMDGLTNVNSQHSRGVYVWKTTGTVRNNHLLNSDIGVQILPNELTGGGTVENNYIVAGRHGLYHNNAFKGSGAWTYKGNTVKIAENDKTAQDVYGPITTTSTMYYGITLVNHGVGGSGDAPKVNFIENTFDLAWPVNKPFHVKSRYGIYMFGDIPADAVIEVHGNSFENYEGIARSNKSIYYGKINASGNWWGSNNPATLQTKASYTELDYTPWFDSGVDTDTVTPGFQPNLSHLHVSVSGQQYGEQTNRIQEAIDMVSGSTVTVHAGTYAGGFTVNKALNLEGPNKGIDPNTGTRVEEAIITFPANLSSDQDLVNISAAGVVFNGFTLDGKALPAEHLSEGVYSEASNVTISHNIVKNFTKIGIRSGAAYGGPFHENVVVKNNKVFSDEAAYAYTYSGVYLQGTQGTVDSNVITNANRGLQIQPYTSQSVTKGVVSNNTISAYRTGLYYNYSKDTTQEWDFTDNQINAIPAPEGVTPEAWEGILTETYSGGTPNFTGNTVNPAGATSPNVYYYREINVTGEPVDLDALIEDNTLGSGMVRLRNAEQVILRDLFASIQIALNNAQDGQAVMVYPGTYLENVDSGNRILKNISVIGVPATDDSLPVIRGSLKLGAPRTVGGDYVHKNLVLENFRIEANLTDTSLYGTTRHALWVENFEIAQLRNLELVGTEPNSMFAIQYGLSVGGRAKNYTIDNVKMENFLIGVYGRALNMTIQNSDISHVEAGMNIMGGGNLTITDSSIVAEVTRNDKQLYAVRFGEGNTTGAPSVLDFHVSNSTLELNNPGGFVPTPGNYMRSVVLRGNAGGEMIIANSNIPQGILNIASLPVEASGNWWGSAEKPLVNVNYTGLVNFCTWLDAEAPDGELISDSGFVTNQNTSKVYCSIQSAIDAATAGDTLLVGPGTYAEQIVINKALTIQGPNADKAGYAEDRVAEAIVTFPAGITALDERLVRIEADDVTILGMNFEYAEYMIGLRPQLLRVIDAGDVTIKNNRFYGGEAGIGTTVTGGAYYSGLVIEDNYINGGPFVNSAYNRGLYIWNTATTIKNNVIESTAIGVQIMPYNEPLSGLVEGNTINGLLYALYINQHQGDSGEWVYRNNSLGIAGTPSDGLTTPVHTPLAAMTARDHYAVYFNAFGTTAATTAPSVRIEGNFMDPTRPAGTFYPSRIQFLAFANSLTGSGNPQVLMMNNSIGAYPRPSGGTPARIHLNASGNWWGTTTQSTVSSRAGGANGDYSPWLASGTDTDTAAPGFQGDFSTLYVTDQGQHFGSTVGRIQEAIDLVSGSTIYVLPGTYQEAVVVDKAVNLYGPNMDVDPNGTVDRGPEAIILGSTTAPAMSTLFELDAENVVVKGFTFDKVRINNYIDGGATGTLTNQFGGVDISNNIFTYVSGTAVYLRDGRNAPGEYSAAVTVQNNLFKSIASAGGVDYNAGSAVVVMGAENLLVDGNVIEDAAYNGIQLARNKTVTVSNNTAVAAQPAIQIAQWNEGNQTISGNDLQTTHASKAAMRFYSFTTDRTPSFVIENNTIHDSVNGIQIGHGDAGKGDDISTADYSFADNTFTDISSHELVVYLPAEATSDQMTEMVEDFRQVYDDSVYVREINGSDPYTYVVDTAPVAVDDAYTTKEDTELVVSVGDGVLKNDTDAENSVLSAVLVTSPAKGSLTLNADGSFSYTPDLDYFGEDAFTYKVVSGETTSNIATVTITVTPEKDQVIANPDFYAVDEDSVLTVSVEDGVLANDEDVDLNHRQATLVESVKNGTLTLNADGSFVYTPKANFHGEDTFTYRLVTYPRINAENPWIDEALVTITVNPILDPPALSTDMPDSVMTGVEYQYGVTLDNPNYGDTFAGVRVLFTLSDTDLADIASLKYYEVQDGTWKDLPLTQDGANVTGWFGPAAGFPMTAPYNATSQFKLTMAVGSADTYAYKMDLYDVVADPDVLLTSLAGSLEVIESPVVTVQDFYYASSSTMKGVSADIRLDHGTTDDATSIVVELFAGEPGAYQLLQTNTANLEKFNAFTVFTSPFDIFGTRNYVGSSWSNVREAEYGQTLTPTRVLATITLLNGDVISDEEIILTGDSSMIQPSVVAEDFGYGRWSGILGVNAGFHTVNFNLGQALGVKVELFTGENGDDLLQTNTWIKTNPAWDGMQQYSAPFDIFGTFNYAADGYWTNERETEYGQTVHPTRVLTTITLPGGVIVTAENTNLTGDRRWIVSTLDEEIANAPDYSYPDGFEYGGEFFFDENNNIYTVIYKPAQVMASQPRDDIARYLGALYRQDDATINGITFNGVDYTWKFDPPEHPELKGSNWRDVDNKTLVSAIVSYMISPSYVPEAGFTLTVTDGYNTETVTFIVIITNTLDAEIGSGFTYEYSDEYEYVGTREFDDPNNIYTVTYDETQVAPHAMYDLARYLGALYRQDKATIIAIAYKGTTYTWDESLGNVGSNWANNGTTLVSVITADFLAGSINPATGIVLTVSDGIHTETVTFKMVITNVAPVAVDDVYETDEDVTLTVAKADGVLKNDTDVSPLTAVIDTDPTNGTVVLAADGSFVYTPNADFNGTDTFTYKANDGELDSNVATVTITVNPVNDAPVAEDQAVTTPEDTPIVITLLATDADGDALTYEIVAGPENGTITIVDNVVTYTPKANWHGTDSFTFKANDGTVDSNIPTVTITVKDVKDDVVANDDAYSVIQGKVLTVAAPGVLANDEDIDENNMSALLKTPPTNGTVVLLGDGSFVYTPNPEFSGEDTFVYTLKTSPGINGIGAWQADATVTITVYGKPVISSDDIEGPYHVGQQQLYHVSLSNPANGMTYNSVSVEIVAEGIKFADFEKIELQHPNGSDTWFDLVAMDLIVEEGNNLVMRTPVIDGMPIEPGLDYTLTFRVTFKTAGQYPVTGTLYYYPASDGSEYGDPFEVAEFTSTMVVLEANPVAVNDAYETFIGETLSVAAPGVLANDTFAGPEALVAERVTSVSNGTLEFNPDGSFTYVPNAGYYGTDSFTYKVTAAGQVSNVATVEINVYTKPTISSDDIEGPYYVGYEQEYHMKLANPEGGKTYNPVQVEIFAGNIVLDDIETIKVEHPAQAGEWIDLKGLVVADAGGLRLVTPIVPLPIEPDNDYTLTFRVTFKTAGQYPVTGTLYYYPDSDGTDHGDAVAVADFSSEMVVLKDIPVAVDDAYETNEDVTLTVSAANGVLKNDTLNALGTLTAVLVEGPANGTLTLNADGSFEYVPNADWNGTDTFTYKANDGKDDSNVATVTITVTPVQDDPVAEDQAVTTPEDTPIVITLLATDADGDALTYAIVTEPTNGTITIVDNVVTYTPKANWHGTDTFTFKANDGTADSNIATVTITVKDVKDDVVANDDAYSVIQGKVLTVAAPGVLENDEDIDENNMSAQLKTPPTNGTVVLLGDGSFVYTPNPEFSGEDTFVYTLKTSPGINGTGAWQADATVTINVYTKPMISSDDIEGPYYVGYEKQYHMKLANPAGGKTYNPVQIEIFAENVVLDDIETIKVQHPTDPTQWIDLKGLVVADNGGLKLITPIVPLPIEPDKDYTLTFLVEFKKEGTYPVTGTLYYYPDSDGTDHGDAVAVADFSSEMVVLKDIPVAVDDAYETDEDVTLTVSAANGVLKNDTLNAPGTLTAVLVETVDAAHGVLTFAADGNFEFVPVANWHGTATFTYKATDGKHESAPATVTIVVKDVKDPVQAVDDVYETNEDTVLTVEAPGVLFNDIDVDLNNQYAYIKSNPTHGTVDLNPNGSFVYTPEANFNGEDIFEYELVTSPRTNGLWTDTAKVTITVKPVNDAPVLGDLTDAEIPVNEAYSFTATATDIDSTDLIFSLVGAPDGATIDETTGVFSWTPGWDDIGANTFEVCVSDGELEDCKEITLTVLNVNTLDEEIRTAPDYSYPDGFEYGGDFSFNDTTNTYTVIYKPAQVLALQPRNDIARYLGALYRQGGATINGITFNGVDYTWKIDPPAAPELKGSNWRDADNNTLVSAIGAYMTSPSYDPDAGFTITVTDGHNTETVTFIVIITNTLDAEIGSGFDYEYDPAYSYVGERDFDDPNNIYIVTYPETQVAPHAMRDLARYLGALYRQDDATIIAIAYKGTTYTWNAEGTLLGSNWEDEDGKTLVSVITAEFVGGHINPAVGIVLTVADGIHTETVTFKMVITNVAPVLDPIADATISELAEYSFTATASDVPTATLTFSLVGAPEGAMINGSTGVFTWTPTEAQGPAEHTFTVKVCDDGNPVMCDEQELTLNVTEVNLPPVLAEIGDKTVVATEELTFTATATDEDIPEQPLTFSLVGAPAGATIDGTTGVFTWTPTNAQVGEHTIEVCVTDGVAVVCEQITVTVEESVVVNEPPVAVADTYETDEDAVLTINAPGVLANDSDPNGDAITAELVDQASHGTVVLAADGSFVYTPEADWNGTDTFTYKAKDAELYSEVVTVTITVKPVNDAPVAVDDTYSVAEDTLLSISAPGVLANDSDVDGDVLNATVRTNPSHGALTLNGDGSFTYLPNPDWHGTDTFTYNLITHPAPTSGWTAWATVTITVTPVNDAPVLDPIADATIPEMVPYTFTATATDVDSTNLTFSLVGAPAGAAINASTGVFTWTPTEAQGPQVYTFTVKVCDDATPSLCDQQSVKLTVTEVNRAPEIEDIEDQEVTVGEELTFTAVASDPDLPANTLTFRLEEAPAGAAIDPTTGKFTWTPVESQIGEHEFHVCVTDGQLNDCTLVKVTVLQGHVNTPPVAVADTYVVDQDQVLTIAAPGVLANDTDADNDTLTAILVSTTSNGTLTFNVDGSFVYTPRAEYFGTDTFTYKANDGKADSNVVTVTITVSKVEPEMPYQMYYPVIFQGW